ncbi:MAG: tRNA preQ1(34) S-adenosylmethionine ribosyltransferase-isomerase QueA [Planctomycetota bacterium]
MRTSDFDYELPPERIAQVPSPERDGARLLVHHLETGESAHVRVRDLPDHLDPGDLLVLNDTRVLPTRFFGRRASGGRVELLLLEPVPDPPGAWRALVNPARKPKPRERISLEGGALEAILVERPRLPDGSLAMAWIVELAGAAGASPLELIARHGRVPLPPYVHRRADDPRAALDRERYQTVYAVRPGAVAAPTAGLHFTPALLSALEEAGISRTSLTLHVGPGTFRPVKTEIVEEHRLEAERFDLPAAAVEAVRAARARGGRVVAVGTTSVRVLESSGDPAGNLEPRSGTTDLFLRPGSSFRVVDALLTNFHLPRSSLLMLVAAFAGRERILALYAEAIARGYRFYSYGDAMLLLRP